jgi:dihydrofolate reductase
MIVSAIAAMSKNRVIGAAGKLPWHIPEDLKFFRQKTLNRICIMGRKTFESVGSKPLPKRMNVIITRQKSFKAEGCHVFHTLQDAMDFAQITINSSQDWGNEVFICGGAEIYKEALPITDVVYLTRIDKVVEGDAYFPEIDPDEWKLVEKIDRHDPVNFSFCTYERQ